MSNSLIGFRFTLEIIRWKKKICSYMISINKFWFHNNNNETSREKNHLFLENMKNHLWSHQWELLLLLYWFTKLIIKQKWNRSHHVNTFKCGNRNTEIEIELFACYLYFIHIVHWVYLLFFTSFLACYDSYLQLFCDANCDLNGRMPKQLGSNLVKWIAINIENEKKFNWNLLIRAFFSLLQIILI